MLELPHTLVGITIATVIPNPLISLPLSLASHFITDYIPHWNPHINTELKSTGKISTTSKLIILSDSTLALMLGTLIAAKALPDVKHFVVLMLAGFMAVLPDVAEIPYYFLGLKQISWMNRLISWQRAHQWNVKPIWGTLFQVVVVGVCLYISFT